MTYVVEVRSGNYFDLDDGPVKMYTGFIYWKGDLEPAGTTPHCYKSETSAKREGTKLRKRLQAYYDQKGKRWELGQRQNRLRRAISDAKQKAESRTLYECKDLMWAALNDRSGGAAAIVAEIREKIEIAQTEAEARIRREAKLRRERLTKGAKA